MFQFSVDYISFHGSFGCTDVQLFKGLEKNYSFVSKESPLWQNQETTFSRLKGRLARHPHITCTSNSATCDTISTNTLKFTASNKLIAHCLQLPVESKALKDELYSTVLMTVGLSRWKGLSLEELRAHMNSIQLTTNRKKVTINFVVDRLLCRGYLRKYRKFKNISNRFYLNRFVPSIDMHRWADYKLLEDAATHLLCLAEKEGQAGLYPRDLRTLLGGWENKNRYWLSCGPLHDIRRLQQNPSISKGRLRLVRLPNTKMRFQKPNYLNSMIDHCYFERETNISNAKFSGT